MDIDERALDSMSVAPDGEDAGVSRTERQDAGQDESIAKRLERNPNNQDAALDEGLDESMDASDPISTTQPGRGGDLPESSGYDAEAEAKRQG
jgi:hypothetical protein